MKMNYACKGVGVILFVFLSRLVCAQQPGMRGYTFDPEKYKVDIQLQKLKEQRIEPYIPTTPKYYASESVKQSTTIKYKAPKYPQDTLVFFVDKFITRGSGTLIFSPGDITQLSADEKAKVTDEMILTGDPKYKNFNIYSLGYFYADYGTDKYNYHANKRTTIWLKKEKGSDKTFFKIVADIERPTSSDAYWFNINNNGDVKIEFVKNGSKQGEIFKTKTDVWLKDGLNEFTVLKLGEVLNFICNGKLIHSITLDHPWTRMFTSLAVNYGVELKMSNYMHVFYPY